MEDSDKREDYRLDDPGPAEGSSPRVGSKAVPIAVCAVAAIALASAIGYFGFKAASADLDAKLQPAASEQAEQDSNFTDYPISRKAPKNNSADKTAKALEAGDAEDPESSDHKHKWKTVYKTVEHKAVYQTATETHTVCNTCGKVIDGKTEKHIEKTGHTGYTTGVPRKVEKLVSAAYTEKVADHRECRECGKTKSLGKRQ